MVIDATAAGLDHKDVFTTDRVLDLDASLTDRKLGESDASGRDAELVADCVDEFRVGGTAEDNDVADHVGGGGR